MAFIDKLTGLVSGGASKLIDSIGNALDKNITNKGEMAAAKLAIEQEVNRHNEVLIQEATKVQLSEDASVSDRWKADMASGSWLSNNIRPLTLASLLIFVFTIILSESVTLPQSIGIGFGVKESYVSLLENLTLTVVVAYFGSRGIEKYQKIKQVK